MMMEPEKTAGATIQLKPRGPIAITGTFEIILEDGTVMPKSEKISLCRCGMSQTLPICDGAHKALGSIM